MIRDRKAAWFAWLFARHARTRIRGAFGRVMVHGMEAAKQAVHAGPVLAVVNHSSWWDPLVVLWLSELELGADGYAMMDAKNLRRLPFFTRVGAFGVDLDDALDGARAVRHAAKRLGRAGRVVWIFPEGEERSPYAPLVLRPGAAGVGRVAREARVLPVGLRYVFGARERPDLWISFGETHETRSDVATGMRDQEASIARELARIDGALADAGEREAFACVHDAGASGDDVGARLLARLLPLR